MRQTIMAFVFVAALAQFAEARIGETYGQCAARYGSSYTNFPGLDHLYGVAVFEKDGINVTVAYDRPNKQGFLAMYTNGRFLAFDDRKKAGDLKDNEIDSLMASLNVSGETAIYTPPKSTSSTQSRTDPSRRTCAGPRNTKGGASSTPSPPSAKSPNSAPKPKWTENLVLVTKAAGAFVGAITLENPSYDAGRFRYKRIGLQMPPSASGARLIDTYGLVPFRRSGNHLFAFKLVADGKCYGIILINSDAAKAISDWAAAYVKKHDKPPAKDKGRTLEGF